jgi:ribosomal protein L19
MSAKNTIIQKIEQDQLKTDIPEFSPGDLVVVQVFVRCPMVLALKELSRLTAR